MFSPTVSATRRFPGCDLVVWLKPQYIRGVLCVRKVFIRGVLCVRKVFIRGMLCVRKVFIRGPKTRQKNVA